MEMKQELNDRKKMMAQGDIAVITDIQRYSVHDGPGIRSLVFFKGCPLRCQWCHNPETHDPLPELLFNDELCIGCGACVVECPTQSISVVDNQIKTEKQNCLLKQQCVDVCYAGARKISGHYYTVDEVYEKVIRDRIFYDTTGGGVTLSGGEVLVYWKFAAQLLQKLKHGGIHTAIETCGYSPWNEFEKVLDYTDLVLYDVKHCDGTMHRRFTGKGNRLILENLKKVSDFNRPVIIRIPVIPGFNDTRKNMQEVAHIAAEIGAKEIHLLPFHQIGESKWDSTGKTYHFRNIEEPSKESMAEIKQMLAETGVPVVVGGS